MAVDTIFDDAVEWADIDIYANAGQGTVQS